DGVASLQQNGPRILKTTGGLRESGSDARKEMAGKIQFRPPHRLGRTNLYRWIAAARFVDTRPDLSRDVGNCRLHAHVLPAAWTAGFAAFRTGMAFGQYHSRRTLATCVLLETPSSGRTIVVSHHQLRSARGRRARISRAVSPSKKRPLRAA